MRTVMTGTPNGLDLSHPNAPDSWESAHVQHRHTINDTVSYGGGDSGCAQCDTCEASNIQAVASVVALRRTVPCVRGIRLFHPRVQRAVAVVHDGS